MRVLLFAFCVLFFFNSGEMYSQLDVMDFRDIENNVSQEECTIGVAIGGATADGRPLLWKTRDYASEPDNEVIYNALFPNKFISVSTAGSTSSSRMGVNEHGFAIVNSLSIDLPLGSSGPNNGALMRDVLGKCRTVVDFQNYLDSTNITGRSTRGNFGVIDSTGAAVIFEADDTHYWKFDAADSPNGYLIRTNFTINGGGSIGIERYNRSSDLISSFYYGDSLNYRSIIRYQMRDFSDSNSNLVTIPFSDYWEPGIPFGYIGCNKSICHTSSVSSAVIHGVLPTELAGLSTMWTILGQPATSIAIPYWPVGNTPVEADGILTSSLCDKANEIRASIFDYLPDDNYIDTYKLQDSLGGGLWSCTYPIEDGVFADTELYMDSLRMSTTLPVISMINKESVIAENVLTQLQYCFSSQPFDIDEIEITDLIQVYPNPFNNGINIKYFINQKSYIRIDILSFTGQIVETIINEIQFGGNYLVRFKFDEYGLSDGIYFVSMNINSDLNRFKIVKIANH